ncbi:hypothetical protein B0F90DRAFT_1678964 [Multifurca ochricompacta]|uniref:DUF1764-domain-containing protein n=1 Tax=Multifurca ochricompacta TaxID=376703 RepID=A0AAD4MCR6_9AGAM|nr:hypothetical protein B0F90DRAFT_1678964 [Multifurca ochricompacta]
MSKSLTSSSSEIDDIFSRKPKSLTLQSLQNSTINKKKRFVKRSQTHLAQSKRQAPEIVFDPSAQPSHVSTSSVVSYDRLLPPGNKKRKIEFDQDKFRDSRGTGPRRKTEEGFSIYKEDELGINAETGGTPLCPFDCNCCF